jgi:hypothetical protein
VALRRKGVEKRGRGGGGGGGVWKPYWPQYQAAGSSNFNMVDVNCTQIGVVGDFDVSAQCDFWHGMSCIVRN